MYSLIMIFYYMNSQQNLHEINNLFLSIFLHMLVVMTQCVMIFHSHSTSSYSVFYISSMKTSFFKWKPDLDSAASEYTKAGKRENSVHVWYYVNWKLL